jgi:hypothetical protein
MCSLCETAQLSIADLRLLVRKRTAFRCSKAHYWEAGGSSAGESPSHECLRTPSPEQPRSSCEATETSCIRIRCAQLEPAAAWQCVIVDLQKRFASKDQRKTRMIRTLKSTGVTFAAAAVIALSSAIAGAAVPPYHPGTSHPQIGPAFADAGHSLIHRPSPWGSTNRPYPLVNADFRIRVQPSSIRISLDGRTVTRIAKITALGFEFTPAFPLRVGRHTIRITGASQSGAVISDGWSFTVSST